MAMFQCLQPTVLLLLGLTFLGVSIKAPVCSVCHDVITHSMCCIDMPEGYLHISQWLHVDVKALICFVFCSRCLQFDVISVLSS